MDKFIVLLVGANHTKGYLYDEGVINNLAPLPFEELKVQTPNIFVFSKDPDIIDYHGLEVTTITPSEQAVYTVAGIVYGSGYEKKFAVLNGDQVVYVDNKHIINQPPDTKSDVLVVADAEFLSEYSEHCKEFLEHNRFYDDELQPYFIRMENMVKAEERFQSLWHTRVLVTAQSICAKYIIPTKIDMCLGIINTLKTRGK